jgi:transposase InsO family protein
MGWEGVTIMDQRVRFIAESLRGVFSFKELCSQFSISRKTGYKWIERYEHEGPGGLADRSRRPHTCPHVTDEAIIEALIRTREKHPFWGPKKLIEILAPRFPDLPAISTTADILKRKGLINGGKRRLRRKHPGCPKTIAQGPNDIWTADYKGHFKMRNGLYCYPLTVCDMNTRYLLGCHAHSAISLADTKAHFTRLFQEYGLPQRIRTDNGVPFASNALARLSTLSVWWIKLGIYPEQIEPGKPQQNGKHERMHRTMKKEATIPPEKNLRSQQDRFDIFRKEYNTERPHEALGQKTPSSFYVPSLRSMPKKLTHYDYPYHFEVRRVSRNSGIRWKARWVQVSVTLAEEYIGFEEVEDGIHDVYFCDLLIGRFVERTMKIQDVIKRVPIRQTSVECQNPKMRRKVSPMYLE